MNSLELSVANNNIPRQDLIWVDGAHGYPVVSADITNSIRLMNNKTILMCDDIWMKTKEMMICMYQMLVTDSFIFWRGKNYKTSFFRKRIGKEFNGNYKYISFSKLVKD